MHVIAGVVLFAQLPAVFDYYDPPVTSPPTVIRVTENGLYGSPGHATLLPDGRVMMVGRGMDAATGTSGGFRFVSVFEPVPAYQPSPAEHWVSLETPPLDVEPGFYGDRWWMTDDLFCAGQTLLPDGKFFTAGGIRAVIDTQDPTYYMWMLGLGYSTTYDYATDAWTRVPSMMVGTAGLADPIRWYPLATRAKDGKVIVSSGTDLVFIQDINANYLTYLWANRSVEQFDPATGTFSLVAPHETAPPEIWNSDYTHAFQLPREAAPGGFDFLMFGEAGIPTLLSRDGAQRWMVRHDQPRPGTLPGQRPNYSATSALLPMRIADGSWGYNNGTVLVTGGDHGASHEHFVDVYDPYANTWRPRGDLLVHRHLPQSVGLPDGRMLILAGDICTCEGESQPGDVGKSNYLYPHGGMFALAEGTSDMPEIRGYHGVSLLLPDGRVLVAGGRTHGHEAPADEQPTLRYLYPSYMFDSLRPFLWSTPETVGYGQAFQIGWVGRPITDAVFVGLGSMTHAFDANQRNVQVTVAYQQAGANNENVGWLIAPNDPALLPPGHYMLFLLDQNGSAGWAKIVKVQ